MATQRTPGEEGMEALLRDYRRRLEALETRAVVAVGPYQLLVDGEQRLVAKHLPTGLAKVLFDPRLEEPEVPVEEEV